MKRFVFGFLVGIFLIPAVPASAGTCDNGGPCDQVLYEVCHLTGRVCIR